MGVDTKIKLPANVSVRTVGEVIALAAGADREKSIITPDDGAWATEIPRWQLRVTGETHVPTMVTIEVRTPRPVDGELSHFVYYHFEGPFGTRLLAPRSTAFWIAVGRRLVDFFGGRIDYDDSDDTRVDYAVPYKSYQVNNPQDGRPWQILQERLFAIEPRPSGGRWTPTPRTR